MNSEIGAQEELDELRDRLLGLLDKQEIHDVLMRYCRGLDRWDLDLVESAFHPDAIQNQDGQDRPVGDLIEILRNPARRVMKSISHNVTNEQVELHGDVADSECYFFACHRLEHDGADWTWIVSARHLDRFERRDGSWRIAYRRAEHDWSRLDKIGEPPAGLGMIQSSDDKGVTLRFASAQEED